MNMRKSVIFIGDMITSITYSVVFSLCLSLKNMVNFYYSL